MANEAGDAPEARLLLLARQAPQARLLPQHMGGQRLPPWAYIADVACWILELSEWDAENARRVAKYKGFKQTLYRFVFAYEENFPLVKPLLKVILPSGKVQEEKRLPPEAERALHAYTYTQSIDEDRAKQFLDTVFVWKRDNGTYGLMQTWTTDFNASYRKRFELHKYPSNPDPANFKPDALDEFKQTVFRLFDLKEPADPLIWFSRGQIENNHPVYVGSGEELMSFLRIRPDVRRDLRIKSIAEPDGFICLFAKESGAEGEKLFRMDLTVQYCLYKNIGFVEMACVKMKAQFESEHNTYHATDEIAVAADSLDGVITPPFDMDWVSGPAYGWVRSSALVVWGCAIFIVISRVLGSAATRHFQLAFLKVVDSPYWLALPCMVSIPYGIYADFTAMRYLIVPWLQRTKCMSIPVIGSVSYHLFVSFKLFCTLLQIVTIQTSVWWMVTTVQRNADIQEDWEYLWSHSMFGFLPSVIWRKMRPASVAIVFWVLSTSQLLLPLLMSMPYRSEIPGIPQDPGRRRRPDMFYHDFNTWWGMLGSRVGIPPKRCICRESVAVMALASGLKLSGSTSLSYPLAMIKEIEAFQRGYKIKMDDVYEPASQGWEMRCVRELQRLHMSQGKRIWFILILKQAFQMNLQITLFIIDRAQGRHQQFYKLVLQRRMTAVDVIELVSIFAMIATVLSELSDVRTLVTAFCQVKKVVMERLKELGDDQLYAHDDYTSDEAKTPQRFTYYGQDLKAELNKVTCATWTLILLTCFSLWLIGYAILKFFAACLCEHDLWELQSGCLSMTRRAA